MKKSTFAFIAIVILAALVYMITQNQEAYIQNRGYAHGTTYNVIYKHPQGVSIQPDLEKVMDSVDRSLSTYDSTSVISRINRNEDTAPDDDFKKVFHTARRIAENTNGAFDITVAPVVNAWGFGYTERSKVDSATIDSMMAFTGYTKVKLINNRIKKEDPRLMLDVNAIAKGYSVDKTANYLESQGITNYMVEIGGEVRARGTNNKGKPWRIGIDRPIDDPNATRRELKAVAALSDGALATSGNYRRFYIKDGVKYSHTINPKTGFPVRHSLLSASVYTNNCMTADAYATAFMVMGLEDSKALVQNNPGLEAYFIYADKSGEEQVYATEGFKDLIRE